MPKYFSYLISAPSRESAAVSAITVNNNVVTLYLPDEQHLDIISTCADAYHAAHANMHFIHRNDKDHDQGHGSADELDVQHIHVNLREKVTPARLRELLTFMKQCNDEEAAHFPAKQAWYQTKGRTLELRKMHLTDELIQDVAQQFMLNHGNGIYSNNPTYHQLHKKHRMSPNVAEHSSCVLENPVGCTYTNLKTPATLKPLMNPTSLLAVGTGAGAAAVVTTATEFTATAVIAAGSAMVLAGVGLFAAGYLVAQCRHRQAAAKKDEIADKKTLRK